MPTTAGYSGTPLWKKLGYRDGTAAWVEEAPAGYEELLGLPAEVAVTRLARPARGLAFVHLFATRAARLQARLASFRAALDPAGVIWVSWPKRSAGVPTDITEDVIGDVALPMGLVDIKVCAVDAVWSGLKLVIRKELR
jgi:hypothetical protein